MNKNTKIIIGVVVILGTIGICRFLFGFVMLGASTLFSINLSFESPTQYFLTVNELLHEKDKITEKQTRISGAVIGESIEFDEASGKSSFFVADVPADYEVIEQQGGLAVVLENAVTDPTHQRIQIVYIGESLNFFVIGLRQLWLANYVQMAYSMPMNFY